MKTNKTQQMTLLKSESGIFYIDSDGIVQHFEPDKSNPFVDDDSDYTITKVQKSIRTMVIPNGVKGFVSDFMRGVRVTERFELPEGVERIGNNSFDINIEEHCVFANCILPTVIIPTSVVEIGNFAFGSTSIETLQLPASLHSRYGRQFKDSHIEILKLPHEWKEMVSLDKYDSLRLSGLLDSDEFGYLRWPTTSIDRLEFYKFLEI